MNGAGKVAARNLSARCHLALVLAAGAVVVDGFADGFVDVVVGAAGVGAVVVVGVAVGVVPPSLVDDPESDDPGADGSVPVEPGSVPEVLVLPPPPRLSFL